MRKFFLAVTDVSNVMTSIMQRLAILDFRSGKFSIIYIFAFLPLKSWKKDIQSHSIHEHRRRKV